jgi:hypothetical protein
MQGLGFGVYGGVRFTSPVPRLGYGYRVPDKGFRLQGLGFRV